MRTDHIRYKTFAILLLAINLVACSGDPESPEAQIRALIAQAEQMAEEKQLGELKVLIDENYGDNHGYDKKTAVRLLQLYFLRHQSIHLLTRIQSITFPQSDRANVSLTIAMAGTPFPEDLTGFRAEFLRLELTLLDSGDGDWQLRAADWNRGTLQDFL